MLFEDETCVKIFLTLLIKYFQGLRKVRHNELYEAYKSLEELPKSTFNLHLNQHLVKDKWVIRTVKDAQKVYFQINMKKFKLIKVYKKRIDAWMKIIEVKKKEFYYQPIEEQILDALVWDLIQDLFRLKCLILYKTNRDFENKLIFTLADSELFRFLEKWIIEKAVEDEEYKKNVLEKIEGLMEKISRVLKGVEDANELIRLLGV